MASQTQSRVNFLSIGLWVLQALLAAAFMMAGGMKLVTPAQELAAQGMQEPIGLLRFIGASEVLGALGLLLPAALRIKPLLTPIAAALLALVMVLAVGHHMMEGEVAASAPALILGLLCGAVAWGRFKAAPIHPRRA